LQPVPLQENIDLALSFGRGYSFCDSLEKNERESEAFIALVEMMQDCGTPDREQIKRSVETRLRRIQRNARRIAKYEISFADMDSRDLSSPSRSSSKKYEIGSPRDEEREPAVLRMLEIYSDLHKIAEAA
jgi:hypothetical protein